MSKQSHHVVPHKDGWCVKKSGSSRASGCFTTQQEAIDSARSISRNQRTELFIHNKQGQFRARDSHGNDPFPPKG